jgi:prepilin peptidase CpaA
MVHSVAWWPTVVAVSVATVTDLRSRRIPNWLVLPFFVAGVVVSSFLHGWQGAGQSLEGAGLGLLIYGVLFWMGGMGAGDVKLSAAIGAWIGPHQLLIALIMTALVGGVMAVGWAICGGFAKDLFLHASQVLFRTKGSEEAVLSNPKRRKMPYAPAIAIGTLLSFFAY